MNLKPPTTDYQPSTPSKKESGVLLFNKPGGMGSTQALNIIKRLLKLKKAGHAGTLDPFAEGLLLILIGKATRFMEYYGEEKEYISVIRLGVNTDTDDPDGEVVREREIGDIDIEKVREVLKRFEGEFVQKVPLYSAVKVGGKRLYNLARQGKKVELPERKVEIKEIELIDYSLPFLTIRTVVKKGVYLRALARDIGEELGCGAYLYKLKRVYVSPFSIDNAFTLNDIKSGNYRIIPLKNALPHLPSVTLSGNDVWKIRHGMSVKGYYPEGIYYVKDPLGNPVGIGRGMTFALKPEKIINASD